MDLFHKKIFILVWQKCLGISKPSKNAVQETWTKLAVKMLDRNRAVSFSVSQQSHVLFAFAQSNAMNKPFFFPSTLLQLSD